MRLIPFVKLRLVIAGGADRPAAEDIAGIFKIISDRADCEFWRNGHAKECALTGFRAAERCHGDRVAE